ncbi:hypothetical protein J2Z21_004191 [Streptomyces griseochromogenes]|uniref:Uncharacterized protein n=1 Tax=Streptomyces griseochromogenes TaxID=68214 RepID=A0A1B1AV74_9ACTN|nr:hypothetical protein [Streptomyces griseochromogenes]ANP50473.1 hypothetical protein AVL59_13350 [Streptomyces griseochromogenes]MBP2051220.1 hypothetical protein [Streptomyces griseochromogenes]
MAFLVLIAAAAFVIHRLAIEYIEHAERIAVHRYSRAPPGGSRRGTTPCGTATVQVADRRRTT